MILRAHSDELVIISQDPMDVEYLESFFEGSVKFKKESDFERCGFHKTDKREVQVTFTKVGDGK